MEERGGVYELCIELKERVGEGAGTFEGEELMQGGIREEMGVGRIGERRGGGGSGGGGRRCGSGSLWLVGILGRGRRRRRKECREREGRGGRKERTLRVSELLRSAVLMLGGVE